MGRLRVLHVGKYYPPDKGGIETATHLLCLELRKYVDVSVVVSSPTSKDIIEEREGVTVRRAGTLCRLASVSFCPKMPLLIRRARPDLIHFHYPNPAAALSIILSGFSGPIVVTYHSDVIRFPLLGRVLAPFSYLFFRRTARILATSEQYIDSSPFLRRRKARCKVVPLGIYPEDFAGDRTDEVRRIRERFPQTMILAVCRLRYYKGLTYLVEAMRSVDAHLVIIGDGAERTALENQIRRDRLAERVHLLGWVDDLVPYYHACDMLALPSLNRAEAFGLVQLEAMACGKPVINTHIASGVPFVCPHGETGLTVPPGDAPALAAALQTLIEDPSLRQKLGEAGRERVRSLFTAEQMTRKILEVYSEASGMRLEGVEPRL